MERAHQLEKREKETGLISHHVAQVRAMVVVPLVKITKERQVASGLSVSAARSDQARFEEACGLAQAIHLDVVASALFAVNHPRPATLLTQGRIEEIKAQVEEQHIDLVIIDHPLTPVQQRNLEKIWAAKVIDRTGLILEIFGARARTKEGVLQVELAHLNYQKGRLVRSWTHLERQRGGMGFLGGPGETQIEADRRILQSKINRLKQDLEKVVKTRQLHRSKRQKAPYPVVALVGYTNAGKSTLFNALTGAKVQAEDQLFATLDPTLRRIYLPQGGMVILSDTVGFISNLPHHLVAAFRATLEEVVEADLILHVCAIADPDWQAQHQDVITILDSLGIKYSQSAPIIEIWNKIDQVDLTEKNQLQMRAQTAEIPTFLVSSLTGEGIDTLVNGIENRISGHLKPRHIILENHEMALLDWIYRYAGAMDDNYQKKQMVNRYDFDDGRVELKFYLNDEDWGRLLNRRKIKS